MKRYVVTTRNIGPYIIPAIKTVNLTHCPAYGDFIAETGQLFTRSESASVFKNLEDAEARLAEIKKTLLEN